MKIILKIWNKTKKIQLSETPLETANAATTATGGAGASSQQQAAASASKSYNLAELHLQLKTSPLSRELNAEVIAQLVFVTKVFIKEINHILQAVYGFENSMLLDPSAAGADMITPRSLKMSANEMGAAGSTGSFPTAASVYHQQNQASNTTPTYFFYDAKVEIGKISLTGITPTNTTALSVFSGEQSVLTLTNRTAHHQMQKPAMAGATSVSDRNEWLAKMIRDSNYTLKPSIEAKCNLSVELKTSLKSDDKQV